MPGTLDIFTYIILFHVLSNPLRKVPFPSQFAEVTVKELAFGPEEIPLILAQRRRSDGPEELEPWPYLLQFKRPGDSAPRTVPGEASSSWARFCPRQTEWGVGVKGTLQRGWAQSGRIGGCRACLLPPLNCPLFRGYSCSLRRAGEVGFADKDGFLTFLWHGTTAVAAVYPAHHLYRCLSVPFLEAGGRLGDCQACSSCCVQPGVLSES